MANIVAGIESMGEVVQVAAAPRPGGVAAIWRDAQCTARRAAEKRLGLFWAGQRRWRALRAREQGM